MPNDSKTAKNYLKDKTDVYAKGNLEDIVKDDNGEKILLHFGERVEGRTRELNPTEALRLRVHDPLWMLARQWQMGEFRGNNTGTAMSVRCEVKYEDCSADPIEPVTERINPRIDFLAKIESAVYYMDLFRMNSAKNKVDVRNKREELIEKFPIDWKAVNDTLVLPDAVTSEREKTLNKHLLNYEQTYRGKIFDGSMLYNYLENDKKSIDSRIDRNFIEWYKKKYLPASANNTHWQKEDLCYEVETEVAGKSFKGDRYQGGRLSWYTFDYVKGTSGKKDSNTETVLCLPTPATFASAPNKRLWQMEDKKVYLGNSIEEPSEANSVVMRYATMYSNDWMLFPLETKIGKYITVNKIEVFDTFGVSHTVEGTDRAGNKEKLAENEEQWQMFTNSTKDNYKETEVNGLYYAPQLAATIEGKPIEEVKVLRDEMANMVWGVENVVPDGCGDTLDANMYASQLQQVVDEVNEEGKPKYDPQTIAFGNGETAAVEKAKYSYQLQSTVPFNWIPFIPQPLPSELKNDKNSPFFNSCRDIILRRGKMPYYVYNNNELKYELNAVRPQGSILRPEITCGKGGRVTETPMFIHEEAVQATGIRLTKNYQRARWIGGKVYQWLGVYKRQAKTEASSGLVFDELRKK